MSSACDFFFNADTHACLVSKISKVKPAWLEALCLSNSIIFYHILSMSYVEFFFVVALLGYVLQISHQFSTSAFAKLCAYFSIIFIYVHTFLE